MKTIILFLLVFANVNLNQNVGVLQDHETEIILISSNTLDSSNDRGIPVEAFYYPSADYIVVLFREFAEYNVTIVNSRHIVVANEYVRGIGTLRMPVPNTNGIYTLHIDTGSAHLSGRYIVQQ